jgi:hypothetical protein
MSQSSLCAYELLLLPHTESSWKSEIRLGDDMPVLGHRILVLVLRRIYMSGPRHQSSNTWMWELITEVGVYQNSLHCEVSRPSLILQTTSSNTLHEDSNSFRSDVPNLSEITLLSRHHSKYGLFNSALPLADHSWYKFDGCLLQNVPMVEESVRL